MEKVFWQEKWDSDQIGFHQSDYNPSMLKYFTKYSNQNKHVLIPLAGKSKDIIWFLNNGFKVTAIEIIPKAVEDFFKENNLDYEKNGNTYTLNNLTFIVGDILKDIPLIEFDFIYDRASLIALPSETRLKLVEIYKDLINKCTKLYSIFINYDQTQMNGPPFAIDKETFTNYFKEFSHNKIDSNKYTMSRENEVNIEQYAIEVRI